MKRILTIIVSALCLNICHEAIAQNDNHSQDAVYLVSNPQTGRWSYIETDSKGTQKAIVYYSVESIKGDGVNGNIKLRIDEVPYASPKDTTTSFLFFRFKDGEFMMDMSTSMIVDFFGSTMEEKYPNLTEEQKTAVIEHLKSDYAKISGEIRGIPRYPKVGKLPDYEFQFKFTLMNMKVVGLDRGIVGTERIQTEAGLFDCFIMEETISTKALIFKDVEKTKSWYAYGIGLVKEITCDKDGKLVSTMILNKIY